MQTIYDTVLWLQSAQTGKKFPYALPSADTNMATNGWVTLSSIARPEVVVAQDTDEEHRATADDWSKLTMVEDRINAVLGRSDLRCTWIVRSEERVAVPPGLSFQEFRKRSMPPRLFYRDIFCPTSVAEEVSRVSRHDFERSGGKVIVLRDA